MRELNFKLLESEDEILIDRMIYFISQEHEGDEIEVEYGVNDNNFKFVEEKLIEKVNEIEKDIKDMTEDELKQYVSTLKKKDLLEIIDSALDSGDYATLAKLQPYMKESLEWKIYESEIKRFLK